MQALGLLVACAAAVAFGVQYLPVKKYEIYDGTTFQWFMCNGILLSGFVVSAASGDLEHGLSMLVILGGVLWAVSNFLVLPLVKLLGIGVGFSMYHFTNLCVGYMTGRFGLFGVTKTVPTWSGGLVLCDIGCALIAVSFVLMIFVETGATHQPADAPLALVPAVMEGIDEEYRAMYRAWRVGDARGAREPLLLRDPSLDCSGAGLQAPMLDRRVGFALEWMGLQARLTRFYGPFGMTSVADVLEAEPVPEDELPGPGPFRNAPLRPRAVSEPAVGTALPAVPPPPPTRAAQWAKKALGVALALLGGLTSATSSVPSTLFVKAHPELRPTVPVFSMYVGIWVTSNVIYLGYASWAKLFGMKVRHSAIRPAYVSGFVWGLGFCGLITGISMLGFTVCYVIDTVGPIMVASFLSVAVFKEITQKNHLCLYAAAFVLQLVGVMSIVLNGSGGT